MKRIAPLVLAAALWAPPLLSAPPEIPVRIYIAPDDHTDYMWSGDEETYRQALVEMLDYYLDAIDRTAGHPPEHQARWNCDGSFWVWTYERNKTPAEFARLIRRIRDGHISAPLNALAPSYGGMPAEAVLRGMYYAGSLERRFNLRFPLAIAMEDFTLPYGLGALWAGAGARYSWKGICGCAGVVKKTRTDRRPHEIYWWQGPDGSRILMKWNTFLGSTKSIGGYAEAWDPEDSIRLVETDERFRSLYPYRIIGLFGQGWDNLTTLSDAAVEAVRKHTTPGRKVIVSNTVDFFEDFEKTYGRDLPAFSASFGNEWELFSASLAEVSARVRRAVERLRPAEAMSTLTALARPEFLRGREEARDRAWMGLGLYWEHDWTADSKILTRDARAAWQRKIAGEIESYVEELHADAAFALGGLIRAPSGRLRFYVFNPLSWARTDIADLPYNGPWPARVIDTASGRETLVQPVRIDDGRYLKGRPFLRILAEDVPPVGYKVFEVVPGEPAPAPAAASVKDGVMENAFYRVAVAGRGAITSLVDKTRGESEFARAIGDRVLNDLGPGEGSLEVENAGPVSVTLKAVSADPVPHVSRITLYARSRRIDIRNKITRNFGDLLTWSFALNLNAPDLWHEEIGAVIRARLLPDGGHYSPTNSRLDWLTLNHFAAMNGDDGRGIVLSNADCAFMKLGASAMVDGRAYLDTKTPLLSVLAGGQVDGPRTGIPMQGGDTRFLQRFALQTGGEFDAAASMRFALEHQNPLIAGRVRGGNAYPDTTYSFLSISDPNVLLWALKPSEEGVARGIVARVWNLSPRRRECRLSLAGGIRSAERVTHIETGVGPAPLSRGALALELEPWQMATFRLGREN